MSYITTTPHGELYLYSNTDAVTISSTDTWYHITTGSWQKGESYNTTLNTNSISIDVSGTYAITANIEGSGVTAEKSYSFGVSVNDVIQDKLIMTRDLPRTDTRPTLVTGLIKLSKDDELKVHVRNNTDSVNIVVSRVNFSIRKQ